jgi:hypothetical protein
MQKLQFLTPSVDAFLDALRSTAFDGGAPIRLVGDNDFAIDLIEAAGQAGIAIEQTRDVAPVSTRQAQVIVFTETSGEKLGDQLLSCLESSNVVILAPITDWHFSQKPLFLISIPKAGTHLEYELAQALGYHAGVELPEFPKGQTWYCVEYSNSHTVARDFFVDTVRRSPFGNRHHPFMRSPALFIYRHPLDILVSEAHYDHLDGKTAFASWLNQRDFEERVDRLLNDYWLIGSLRERVGAFLPWLEFANVIPIAFEELIGSAGGGTSADQEQLIWSIQLKLQVPGDPAEIAARVFNPNSPTFRSGQIGSYCHQLSSQLIDDFAAKNSDILAQFGYPLDGSIGLPANRMLRMKKPIRYSDVDYESMPLTLESNFLGCNLVRYRRHVYAVPIAAGPVALQELSDEVLAIIPTAPTLSDLKAILLIGNLRFTLHNGSLEKLARIIQGTESAQTGHYYWSDSAVPTVVESYNGFNLVAFRNRYFGIRQSLGAVELSGSLEELGRQQSPDDLLIAQSLEQVRDDIDNLSISKRYRREVAGEYQALKAELEDLRRDKVTTNESFAAKISGLESMLDGLAVNVRTERQMADNQLDALREENAAVARTALEKISVVEQGLTELAAQVAAANQSSNQQLEQLHQQMSAASERTRMALDTMAAQQSLIERHMLQQIQRIDVLEKSWSAKIKKVFARILRGEK